jgi:hypothetical protein
LDFFQKSVISGIWLSAILIAAKVAEEEVAEVSLFIPESLVLPLAVGSVVAGGF